MRARLVSWAKLVKTRVGLRALIAVAAAPLVLSRVAGAQVNLPPPPPPPIDTTSPPPSSTGTTSPSHHPKPPPPKHTAEPAHTAAPPPPPEHHEAPPQPRPEPVWSPRTISLRLNPLPFFAGRISADFEIMLAPHHALVVSPNATLHKYAFSRGDSANALIREGFGFASDDSSGFGAEVGYHYWTKRELDGIFFGPSLVFGGTFPPSGSGVKSFAYVGGAVDVGYQYLFSNGFTLLGGGGLEILGATQTAATGGTAHAIPRLLFGVGWSF